MDKNKTQEATFGAGCFWGVEEAFRIMDGVLETEVGFMGGKDPEVTYEQVCQGDTGHAEVVHLKFDPEKISYEYLLKKFWEIHDPTQGNRQGPDIGEQYRSVIFYYSDEQKVAAEKSLEERQSKTEKKITTEISAAGPFCRAEEYHQKYAMKHGGGSCHV